jgi:hypothetical protein
LTDWLIMQLPVTGPRRGGFPIGTENIWHRCHMFSDVPGKPSPLRCTG